VLCLMTLTACVSSPIVIATPPHRPQPDRHLI